jgi:hypothetical protein
MDQHISRSSIAAIPSRQSAIDLNLALRRRLEGADVSGAPGLSGDLQAIVRERLGDR